MSKIITVSSLRYGVGRTTITCLLGLKLAEMGFKVLAIDNNYKFCDIANYFMVRPEYSVDDLKPFLRSGVLEKETMLSMVVSAEIDILSGSTMNFVSNTLNKEDLLKIKNIVDAEYDYILIDHKAGMEQEETLDMIDIIDTNIIVSQFNKFDFIHYERLFNTLEKEKGEQIQIALEKSIIIYNKLTADINESFEDGKKLVGADKIFKLQYSGKILDFCNGYKCRLDSENQAEIEKIATILTDKEIEKKAKKFDIGNPLDKLKSIFNIF